jgi:hypothetical protein
MLGYQRNVDDRLKVPSRSQNRQKFTGLGQYGLPKFRSLGPTAAWPNADSIDQTFCLSNHRPFEPSLLQRISA